MAMTPPVSRSPLSREATPKATEECTRAKLLVLACRLWLGLNFCQPRPWK